MGESQSRYSIVERLTTKKLELMALRAQLTTTVSKKEQSVQELKADLQNWQTDVQEDVKREQREKEKLIQKATQSAQNAANELTEKKLVIEEQIGAIDTALVSIQKISETSSSSSN